LKTGYKKGNLKLLIQTGLLLWFSVFQFSQVSAVEFPDRLELLGLIEKREYDQLSDMLLSYQENYETGKGDERLVLFVLETLANSNPEYEALMIEWIDSQAENYVPYLVRAYYYYAVAWSWRGNLSGTETSEKRLEKMKNYLQLASADITSAIQLKPRSSATDAHALRVLMMLESDTFKKQTLEEALKIDQASYLVRSSYFWSLKPEWGGQPQEVLRFLEETRLMAEENPQLKQLLGYADYIFAESLAENKQYVEAAIHFDFAVDNGADHIIYRERGINYYHLQDYDKTLESLDLALEQWPQDPKTLRWRAHTLQRMKRYEEALSDLALAVRLVPMERYTLMAHALLSRKMKRYEQVLSDYEKALFFNQNDADIWFEIGMHYSHELVDFEKAARHLRRATELNPGESDYWYEYAAVLHYKLDCGIVKPLDEYLGLCNAGSICRAGELKWALHARNWLKENNQCALKDESARRY
jgi:tetratricopeptide (TPR) repeat protein